MAGTTAGAVFDSRNRMPIEGAAVTAQPGDHTTATGDDGTYSLSLPAGTYSLDITKSGYQSFIAEGVVVLDDVTTEINVAMPPADF